MKTSRGSRVARTAGRAGEAAARARVAAVLRRVDRLTPDELARIGLSRADPDQRGVLLDAVAAAARAGGRSELLAAARAEAREVVLNRYSAGSLRPTWMGLNWGVSQGTAADRVAIVEALEDAAAAAVVEDLVDPEITAALAIDADRVLAMPVGDASEGSLDRALRPSPLGTGRVRALAIVMLAVLLGSWAFAIGLAGAGPVGGLAGIGLAALVVWTITRVRRRPEQDGGEAASADAGPDRG